MAKKKGPLPPTRNAVVPKKKVVKPDPTFPNQPGNHLEKKKGSRKMKTVKRAP